MAGEPLQIGTVTDKRARPFDLGGLFREALKHGRPNVYLSNYKNLFCAYIERQLGASKLQTKPHYFDTPESALLAAVEEADLWGLPDLEVTI